MICSGAPPPAAVAFKRHMCDLFFGSLPALSESLVKLLPNGDWRKQDVVEFYANIDLGTCVNRQLVAQYLALGLIKAFLPNMLHVYARHHWTGAEIAVEQQGLLEACHGLFRRTYRRFVILVDGHGTGACSARSAICLPAAAPLLGSVPQREHDQEQGDVGLGAQSSGAGVSAPPLRG